MYRCIVHFSWGEREDRLVGCMGWTYEFTKNTQCQTVGRQKMLAELDRILAVRDSLVTRAKRPPHTRPPMGLFHNEATVVGRTKDMKIAVGTDRIDRLVSIKL